MTAVWFVIVAVMALSGLAAAWTFTSVVLEVLREPLPPSLQPATRRSPAPTRAAARPALRAPAPPAPRPVRNDDPTDEALALFTRSREAAGARAHRSHDVAGRRVAGPARPTTHAARPVGPRVEPARGPREPDYVPSWGDLLAETLREVESVRT